MNNRLLLLAFFLISAQFNVSAQIIVTAAGTTVGNSGNEGPATMAKLTRPNHVRTDNAGNVYIADFGNHVVRRIDASGIIHLFAGSNSAGYSGDGGAATAAKLYSPSDVATDNAGNVYISEAGNNCIRKVDASGTITTIAGNGIAGYTGDNGPATAALLYKPMAVALDGASNLYVADYQNNVVRKINNVGIISTIAGDTTSGYSGDGGPATAALFVGPIDLALDKLGNIYIADIQNNAIRKINSSGIITTVAGTGTGGYNGDGISATSANLKSPYAVCVDSANQLYITDNENNRIRKVDASGTISAIVGTGVAGYSGDGGPATNATIKNTGGITFDASGNLYIADFGNNVVRKVIPHDPIAVAKVSTTAASISVYPNPASGVVNIDLTSTVSQYVSITLYGADGKEGPAYREKVHEGKNTITIDLHKQHIPPGNYNILVMDNNGSISTHKLTILYR